MPYTLRLVPGAFRLDPMSMLNRRQIHRKGCTYSWLTFNLDPSAVSFDDGFTLVETYTQALFLG